MKEKDEFTTLFSGLADTKMQVREGFWEHLEQDLAAIEPVVEAMSTPQPKAIPLYRKWVAAASVLLVVAAGSVAFWSLNSQEEQIQQAFNEVVANVDAVGESVETSTPIIYNSDPSTVNGQHSLFNGPSSRHKSTQASNLIPASFGTTDVDADADDDDEMVPFEVTFQIIEQGYINNGNPTGGLMNASDGNLAGGSEGTASTTVAKKKQSGWALKPAIGTALPKGDYKMPLTAGMSVERKINKTLAVEAGLLYNYLPVHNDENQSSLSLPVKLDVNLAEGKKVDVYASVGGVVEKLLGKSFSEEPVQLAATAGLGVRYKLNDNLAVYAEPSVSHYFDTDGTTRTLRTEQAVNVNLLCGVRMSY